MAHTRDARGQLVYAYGEIPSGTYPRIQPTGALYGTKAIGTIAVDALFVTGLAWCERERALLRLVLRAFAAAKPAIATLVQPQ